MADEMYQIITLNLSDGRRLKAVVKEFCKEGDRLFVHPQFEVTEPREMGEGCYWADEEILAEREIL